MLKNKALLLFVMVASFSYFLKADTMQHNTLTLKQQSTITIAAFTANGDLDKLKNALVSGLNVGLNVNEIKEICVHLYAYTGFPRSLNALNTFSTLLSERQAQGIYDTIGEEATPLCLPILIKTNTALIREPNSWVKKRSSPLKDTNFLHLLLTRF